MQKENMTLEGYVARDKYGMLCFFPAVKPVRYEGIWMASTYNSDYIVLEKSLLQDLKWDSEPKKAMLTISIEEA